MLIQADVSVEPGDSFELWARRKSSATSIPSPAVTIFSDDRIVYRIAALPPYFQHFAHTHYSRETLRLEWDSDEIESSLFYRYNPATVRDEGITLLRLTDAGLETWPIDRLAKWYAAETGRPTLRFSPAQGWMNDPNGLCKLGDDYHLFYQFHPNGTDWGPMHWGHAVSRDLYRWTHLPVFVHPQQNLAALGATGGAFSGNAFFDRDGQLSFYYTERLPAYDLFKDYKEIQKHMVPSDDLLRPVANRIVQTEGGPGTAHDVRDPKVWYDDEAGLYRMVLGAAVDGDPAILLHSSLDGHAWSFTSVLYRAPSQYRAGGARCVECPDFFRLGDHWVLVAGFVGYTEAETGRHNLLYASVGTYSDGVFTPYSDDLQELDFGTDYYAMQSFWDGERQLALAWLFNWEFRKPAGSAYSGEMSLPRVLSVNADRQLTMRPEPAYKTLRSERLVAEGGRFPIPNRPQAVELDIHGDLTDLHIVGRSSTGPLFTLRHQAGVLEIEIPEDLQGKITYRSTALDLTSLHVFFDRGVIEIFGNDGSVCGTRRTYRMDDLSQLEVQAKGLETMEAWQLASAWGDLVHR